MNENIAVYGTAGRAPPRPVTNVLDVRVGREAETPLSSYVEGFALDAWANVQPSTEYCAPIEAFASTMFTRFDLWQSESEMRHAWTDEPVSVLTYELLADRFGAIEATENSLTLIHRGDHPHLARREIFRFLAVGDVDGDEVEDWLVELSVGGARRCCGLVRRPCVAAAIAHLRSVPLWPLGRISRTLGELH